MALAAAPHGVMGPLTSWGCMGSPSPPPAGRVAGWAQVDAYLSDRTVSSTHHDMLLADPCACQVDARPRAPRTRSEAARWSRDGPQASPTKRRRRRRAGTSRAASKSHCNRRVRREGRMSRASRPTSVISLDDISSCYDSTSDYDARSPVRISATDHAGSSPSQSISPLLGSRVCCMHGLAASTCTASSRRGRRSSADATMRSGQRGNEWISRASQLANQQTGRRRDRAAPARHR